MTKGRGRKRKKSGNNSDHNSDQSGAQDKDASLTCSYNGAAGASNGKQSAPIVVHDDQRSGGFITSTPKPQKKDEDVNKRLDLIIDKLKKTRYY